jgi:hypothetical protein
MYAPLGSARDQEYWYSETAAVELRQTFSRQLGDEGRAREDSNSYR